MNFNRSHVRAAYKARLCIKRGTKVPGGVIAKLGVRMVQALAADLGRTVDNRGLVGKPA